MPELPDITVYVERLAARLIGQPLAEVRIGSPFVVRSTALAPEAAVGHAVTGIERLGKRLVWSFDGGVHFVLHLMIAGRLRWRAAGAKLPARVGLVAFDFADGSVIWTEQGSKKRASIHVFSASSAADRAKALAEFDRGGLEVLDATPAEFEAALQRENRTLKRALTDPRLFSGIGNAYSDEILFAARLSPMRWTSRLDPEQIQRLYDATRATLRVWTERLRAECGDGFPEKVTAFRAGMAVHGRYREPCVVCGQPVQRIRYADNECNYCAECQNEGRLLADRGLSQLLRKDWPKTLAELEERRSPGS